LWSCPSISICSSANPTGTLLRSPCRPLKLAFARRVLAEQRRRRNLQQPDLFDNTPHQSGSPGFTTSMSGRSARALKSCATCTAIRLSADSSSLLSCGAGAVFATMPLESVVS
jgi:hypothetical protein